MHFPSQQVNQVSNTVIAYFKLKFAADASADDDGSLEPHDEAAFMQGDPNICRSTQPIRGSKACCESGGLAHWLAFALLTVFAMPGEGAVRNTAISFGGAQFKAPVSRIPA